MTHEKRTGLADERQWLAEYFGRYQHVLRREDVWDQLVQLKGLLVSTHVAGGKIIIAGNGGSAAIANHCAVDFTKNAGIRCVTFNESSLITCLANDFGYEHWLGKALEFYAEPGDVAILISSSGRSRNMIRGGRVARERQLTLVTLTGFDEENPLQQLGELNFWVESRAYNVVEMMHQMWLLAVCDLIIGDAEYPATPATVGAPAFVKRGGSHAASE